MSFKLLYLCFYIKMTPEEWLHGYLNDHSKIHMYPSEFKNVETYQYFIDMFNKSNDNPNMINLMGLICSFQRDFDNAIKYYKLAIEKDCHYALFNLGNLYHNVPEKKDLNKAIRYYEMAIEKNYKYALYCLAYVYHYQQEKKDLDKAIKYYKLAVDNGVSDAMNNLGYLYEIEKHDLNEAIKYYKMAIENGSNVAMFNLGHLYQNEPDKIDLIEAIKYYKMAIVNGNVNAKKKILEIYNLDSKYLVDDILENHELKKQNEKQKEYITELEFMPGGVGYEECKQHFKSLIQ